MVVVRLASGGGEGEGGSWGELHVVVLKEALALKPPLSTEVLAALLCRADTSADVMGSSLKFGNFVFTLVRSYLPLLGPHAAVARKVAASLTTFMGRNTLKLLDKI